MTAPLVLLAAFQPSIDPVADSLAISALVALLPLVTVFVTLGLLRWKAHWAGLSAVVVAIIVASLFFEMPVQLAALAATQGAAFGIFPIMWIVFTAILAAGVPQTRVTRSSSSSSGTYGLPVARDMPISQVRLTEA